jgi:hypothetical protein
MTDGREREMGAVRIDVGAVRSARTPPARSELEVSQAQGDTSAGWWADG